ncbi:MAG: hypothetical protein IPN04_08360 [Rhodoferax sp.]|nr:hypothetical protein [Rhodoferax sp.]
MHCCGSRVVLKKSSLGTQFFAHSKKGVCITAPESVEHLFAKSQVATSLIGTDWSARTEVTGKSPMGEQWIADVLLNAGSKKVAIEIQWSPQDQEETQRRQKRYKDSGIRGLWLFRKPTNLLSEKHTPTFLLEVDIATKLAKVKLQSDFFPLLPTLILICVVKKIGHKLIELKTFYSRQYEWICEGTRLKSNTTFRNMVLIKLVGNAINQPRIITEIVFRWIKFIKVRVGLQGDYPILIRQ